MSAAHLSLIILISRMSRMGNFIFIRYLAMMDGALVCDNNRNRFSVAPQIREAMKAREVKKRKKEGAPRRVKSISRQIVLIFLIYKVQTLLFQIGFPFLRAPAVSWPIGSLFLWSTNANINNYGQSLQCFLVLFCLRPT